MTPARGATPALVRDFSLIPEHIPGAFPSAPTSPPPGSRQSNVFDRLYPSLTKYQRSSHIPKSPPKSPSKLAYLTRSLAKLTGSPQHDTSFLSAPASRRNVPRISALPTYPPIDDVAIDVDTTAEYAIVISMYEVHNDRIFDLLSGSAPQKRRALLFKSTGMSPDRKVVAGLKKIVCSDLEEALMVLETGRIASFIPASHKADPLSRPPRAPCCRHRFECHILPVPRLLLHRGQEARSRVERRANFQPMDLQYTHDR